MGPGTHSGPTSFEWPHRTMADFVFFLKSARPRKKGPKMAQNGYFLRVNRPCQHVRAEKPSRTQPEFWETEPGEGHVGQKGQFWTFLAPKGRPPANVWVRAKMGGPNGDPKGRPKGAKWVPKGSQWVPKVGPGTPRAWGPLWRARWGAQGEPRGTWGAQIWARGPIRGPQVLCGLTRRRPTFFFRESACPRKKGGAPGPKMVKILVFFEGNRPCQHVRAEKLSGIQLEFWETEPGEGHFCQKG